MKAAVRCNALTMAALRAQEKHGKRQDASSKSRRVRDAAPIVGLGLDLAELLAAHTQGTKRNAGAGKVALHFVIRFPPEILTDEAPAPYKGKSKDDRLRLMARQAGRFINEAHGGNAVFALRVDRDEIGETVVDVFACPKYIKATKKAETEWTSLTKFGKALAVKHQDEVRRRSKNHEGAGPITSPRAVGMALQSEFAAFFERENGAALTRKVEKERPGPDRIEVEEWRVRMAERERVDAEAAAEVARNNREAADIDAARIRQEAQDEKADFRRRAGAWVKREQKNIADTKQAADADRSAAAAELITARSVLERLEETYAAVRATLPRIRRILTWDFATEDERRRAKADRKQVVKIAPVLRNAIRDAKGSDGDKFGWFKDMAGVPRKGSAAPVVAAEKPVEPAPETETGTGWR